MRFAGGTQCDIWHLCEKRVTECNTLLEDDCGLHTAKWFSPRSDETNTGYVRALSAQANNILLYLSMTYLGALRHESRVLALMMVFHVCAADGRRIVAWSWRAHLGWNPRSARASSPTRHPRKVRPTHHASVSLEMRPKNHPSYHKLEIFLRKSHIATSIQDVQSIT